MNFRNFSLITIYYYKMSLKSIYISVKYIIYIVWSNGTFFSLFRRSIFEKTRTETFSVKISWLRKKSSHFALKVTDKSSPPFNKKKKKKKSFTTIASSENDINSFCNFPCFNFGKLTLVLY